MNQNYQQKYVPYSADPLDVHDSDLLFAREWGAETNPELGDAFATTPGGSLGNATAAICARTGALEVHSDQDTLSPYPRGQSFLLPDWTQTGKEFLPDIEGAEGTFAAVLFAKIRALQTSLNTIGYDQDMGEASVPGLIVGGLDLVGETETAEFSLVELLPDSGGNYGIPPGAPGISSWNPGRGALLNSLWAGGAVGGPGGFDGSQGWGASVYLKIFMLWSQKFPETEGLVFASSDGVAWTGPIGNVEIENPAVGNAVARRVGLSIRNDAWGQLDWVRLYQYQLAGTEAEIIARYGSFLYAVDRFTGARQFIR